jgi:hypothetical protein
LFQWIFVLFDKPGVGTVESPIAPIYKYLDQRKELFSWTEEVKYTDTYLEIHKTALRNRDVANGGSAYGSRLLSREGLADVNVTAGVFAEVGPSNDASKPKVLAPSLPALS